MQSRFLIRFSPIILLCFYFSLHAQTLDVPYLAGRVNDVAHMLSQTTVEELEAMLKTHEDSTSNQVVVLTIPGLQGEVLEDYSIRVVETWKIGQANNDNGVLLLIVRDDRKMRIEVGSGLEGDLPDITGGRIIRNEITPRFRDGDFDGGVRAGVHAILAAIQGAYAASEAEEESSGMDWVGRLIMFGIFAIVVGIFTLICIVSQGFAGWFLYFFLIPFWLAFPMVSLGVTIGLVLFFGYLFGVGIYKLWLTYSSAGKKQMQKWGKKWAASSSKGGKWRASRSGGAWSGGGAWSSGSSWSSSSSSGSSFSGGGGSFSGGGASGSW